MIRQFMLMAALAIASQGVLAKDWNTIRLATEGAYPPFNTTGTDGEVGGFDVDIGNALCAQMKAKCSWVKQEWDGMIPALMGRKFDAIIASMSITEDRKKKVAFTDKYYATPLALVTKEGSGLRPDVDALQGKRIGVQRGTVADTFATRLWADKGVDIVRYAKQDEIYLDLGAGRLDATWVDALMALGGFLEEPAGEGYEVAGKPVFGRNAAEKAIIGEGVGIAVRKRDTDLKEKLDQALAAIRADGTYNTIRKNYFDEDIYGD